MNENWTPELTSSMVAKYPELSEGDNMDMFKRKWEYMFVYCEVGYARQWVNMHIWTFLRPVTGIFASRVILHGLTFNRAFRETSRPFVTKTVLD